MQKTKIQKFKATLWNHRVTIPFYFIMLFWALIFSEPPQYRLFYEFTPIFTALTAILWIVEGAMN